MIVCQQVSKFYGAHAAVESLSFTIGEGEVVGLLGLNGAGKTTTLRILSGLLLPTAGRVEIYGLDMGTQPEAARARLGFLPETPPLYPEMTVVAYLRFVARIKGMRGGAIAAALHTTLASTDLLDVQDEVIATLSHGFRRRVGIAQAIVNDPKLILLDEPTAGLDPVQIVQMRTLLRRLRGKNTILISSHILGEVHQLCDRIFVLNQGRIAAEGREDDLAQQVDAGTHAKLVVRGSQDSLAALLHGLPFVESHRLHPEAAQGLWRVHVTMRLEASEELVSALVHAGFGVREVGGVEGELEHIFLRLTGGAKES